MFKPKTVTEAKKQYEFLHQVQMKNIHFGGWTLITLIFAIGGCIFTFNPSNQTLSRSALGLGGAALFLHGLSMQIDQTSEKIKDDLVEIIATENRR